MWEQLEVISAISLAAAVLAILKCYKTLKPNIEGHRALLKLLAFKLLIGLTFIENVRRMIPKNNAYWFLTNFLDCFLNLNVNRSPQTNFNSDLCRRQDRYPVVDYLCSDLIIRNVLSLRL